MLANPKEPMHPNVHSSTIYNSQLLEANLSAHQQMSGSNNYGTFTQWNSTQQRERRSLYPLQQHGWNLREPAIELFYQLSLRPNCWWTKTAEVLTCFYFYVCIYLWLFKYSCLHFHPTMPCSHPSLPPTLEPTTFGFVCVSFIHVPWWPFPDFPTLSSPPPLWLLSVCYLFQCLWLYFICLFVLLIRFHL